jgi:hypothetical protein
MNTYSLDITLVTDSGVGVIDKQLEDVDRETVFKTLLQYVNILKDDNNVLLQKSLKLWDISWTTEEEAKFIKEVYTAFHDDRCYFRNHYLDPWVLCDDLADFMKYPDCFAYIEK